MGISTFLNGQAPAQLRGLQWLALTDVGTLLSATAVSDSGGGATTTWGTAAADVPCRIDSLAGGTRDLIAGRIDERSTHLITTPAGTPVHNEHQFVITGRGTFEVTAVREQTAQPAVFFEAVEAS